MSDTSGTGGFGPSTRAIRNGLKETFGNKSGGSQSKKGKKDETLGAVAGPNVQVLVWQKLDHDHMLKSVLLPSELIYYLDAMARFIDGAKRGGLTTVVNEFGLREESTFPSLRRSITSHAPGNAESSKEGSEQHSRAGGAFNAGSARWAQKISSVTDPTQIVVRLLVDKIRSGDRYDEALMLSARLILREYGERVIHALIREDDAWATKASQRLIDDFDAQLNKFFAEHPSATDWSARRIVRTLEMFPAFVKR